MNRATVIVLSFLPRLLLAQSPLAVVPAVGSPLPAWTPGTLDIHQISTGRGNSALLILPDGTTLLVDAGAAGSGIPQTDQHPDSTRSPGDWIARYVKRHLPAGAKGLDYAMITHFHADHFGQLLPKSPASANGNYRLAGVTEVGDAIPIHRLLDRGWPDYNYPAPLADSTMANYRRFVDAQRAKGMTIERFRAGSRDQIKLQHNPGNFPRFEIRNIVANGDVWSGTGDGVNATFPALSTIPPADWPNENMCSLGIRLTYGNFSYFTGGDLTGITDPGFPTWHAVETAVAAAVGPVDVHVVNQHGSMGEESEAFLKTLASKVLIIPSWAPSHPAPDVLKRIVNSRFPPSDRLVFATEMRDAARIVIGRRADSLAGPPGHIIVRVEPGGARYWIIVLSNRDESDSVVAVKGPFQS